MRVLAGTAPAPSPTDGILAPIEKLSSRRRHTATVGLALGRNPMTRDIAQRIGNCSLRLALALEQQDDQAARAHITAGMFCQARLCPICEWRRTRAWRGRLIAGLGRFAEVYPTHRAIFLTLTVRNVPVHQTRETIKAMHSGWAAMARWSDFPTQFWLRRTEVTIGAPSFSDGLPSAPTKRSRQSATANPDDPTDADSVGPSLRIASPYGLWAHPHIHSLLMVPASYFSGRRYLKQAVWQERWALAMGLDYPPVVDVRPASSKAGSPVLADAAQDAVMEAAKYITKANHIAKLGPLAAEMHMQLKGQRMIQLSQSLGKFVRDGEVEPGEYLDGSEVEASTLPIFHTVVQWDSLLSEYRIAP
jgi:plasmid rolling circle replication initiator protein Rep